MAEDASSFWTDIQRFEDMLAADPGSRCFAALSELYRRIGLLDDAISTAEKGSRLHPDYYGGFLALGAACFDKGLNAEARRALERVLALKPDDLRAQKILGRLYADAGETALARRALNQVLRQTPEDVESALLLRTLGPVEASPEMVAFDEEEELFEDLEVIDEEEIDVLEEIEEEPAEADLVEPQALDDLEDDEFWDLDEPEPEVVMPAAAPAAGAAVRSLHVTATMAELYVSQGFLDRALAVYEELLIGQPENQSYRLKAAELRTRLATQAEPTSTDSSPRISPSRQVPQPSPSPTLPLRGREPVASSALEAELESWLVNIGVRRHGA